MLILSFLALLLLTIIMYALAGRSIFHPAVVFCGAWSIVLFILLISGKTFYSVSAETLTIVVVGAISFSLGSLPVRKPLTNLFARAIPRVAPGRLLTILVAVIVFAFPLYLGWLLGLILDNPKANLLQSARQVFVDLTNAGAEKYTPSYIFFVNLMTLAQVIAMTCWAERSNGKRRAMLAMITALLYLIVTGGRSTTVQLLLSLVCIEWIMIHKLRWKLLFIISVSLVLVFGLAAIFVHNTDAVSFGDITWAVTDEFINYAAGPLVAFDHVITHSDAVPHNPNAAAFFVETASKLGLKVDVPPRNSDFVPTGPYHAGNVFTIYFSYLDAGWPLTFLLIALQGFLLCLIYQLALTGRKVAVIMYAVLFPCIALSVFSDFLVSYLNPLLKTWFYCWLLYSFPRFRLTKPLASNAGCTA